MFQRYAIIIVFWKNLNYDCMEMVSCQNCHYTKCRTIYVVSKCKISFIQNAWDGIYTCYLVTVDKDLHSTIPIVSGKINFTSFFQSNFCFVSSFKANEEYNGSRQVKYLCICCGNLGHRFVFRKFSLKVIRLTSRQNVRDKGGSCPTNSHLATFVSFKNTKRISRNHVAMACIRDCICLEVSVVFRFDLTQWYMISQWLST